MPIINFPAAIFNRLPYRIRKLIFRVCRMIPCVIRRNRLLIVRLDAIGDYVLFRNCIHALKASRQYGNFSFSLLGNSLWLDLAENLDHEVIDRFIRVEPDSIYHREKFEYNGLVLYCKLKFMGFRVVIHPVHSRMLLVDTYITELGIPERIASSGDDINYNVNEKPLADQMYTKLVPVPGASVFEFNRNRAFISGLTGIKEHSISLSIPRSIPLNKNMVIAISPGAGHVHRRWPATKFAGLMQQLSTSFPRAEFHLFGSKADIPSAEIIRMEATGFIIKDFTGKATLMEFVVLLQNASLLVGNDSSSIHMAAALNIPAVCISNGNMFGRFQPYPDELQKTVKMVYPDPSFYDPGKFEFLVEKTKVRSEYDISTIAIAPVYDACIHALKGSHHNLIQ